MIFGPLLLVGLIAAAGWDVGRRRVPNRLNLIIWLAGLAFRAIRGPGWSGLIDGGLGTALAFGLVIVPFALRLHRGGDAKLIMALGMWLGPLGVFWAYLWGVAVGGLVALGLLVIAGPALRRRVARHLGLAVSTISLPHVDPDRDARLHVPMALAFSIGAVLAVLI